MMKFKILANLNKENHRNRLPLPVIASFMTAFSSFRAMSDSGKPLSYLAVRLLEPKNCVIRYQYYDTGMMDMSYHQLTLKPGEYDKHVTINSNMKLRYSLKRISVSDAVDLRWHAQKYMYTQANVYGGNIESSKDVTMTINGYKILTQDGIV